MLLVAVSGFVLANNGIHNNFKSFLSKHLS